MHSTLLYTKAVSISQKQKLLLVIKENVSSAYIVKSENTYFYPSRKPK